MILAPRLGDSIALWVSCGGIQSPHDKLDTKLCLHGQNAINVRIAAWFLADTHTHARRLFAFNCKNAESIHTAPSCALFALWHWNLLAVCINSSHFLGIKVFIKRTIGVQFLCWCFWEAIHDPDLHPPLIVSPDRCWLLSRWLQQSLTASSNAFLWLKIRRLNWGNNN